MVAFAASECKPLVGPVWRGEEEVRVVGLVKANANESSDVESNNKNRATKTEQEKGWTRKGLSQQFSVAELSRGWFLGRQPFQRHAAVKFDRDGYLYFHMSWIEPKKEREKGRKREEEEKRKRRGREEKRREAKRREEKGREERREEKRRKGNITEERERRENI